MQARRASAALLAVGLICLPLAAEEHPVRPYVDPSLLDVKWPMHSHYRQPWRAFLETRRAHDFLGGIGVAYNVSGNEELAMRLLAETGFRALRLEIGWGSVKWDESGLHGEKRLRAVLAACKQYGIRPTLLLNAHQGVPCPTRFFQKRLAADAPQGSRTVRLTDTRDLVAGRSGINQLTTYWAAEALVTRSDARTGTCTLSKPLPKALKADRPLSMATLKYLPLYPVGRKEYDDTAAGWVRYALLVCDLAAGVGLKDFDVEIWNELTFGTRFLRINNYCDPPVAPAPGDREPPDFLNKGGTCWELARRTVEAVKARHPRVRCIWGFSNTTFYHCRVRNLPPRMDGQSYHPYGTGMRRLPKRETHPKRPEFCLERFVPTIDIRMPEGWAHTFVQTECLMRLLNPTTRLSERPPGSQRFFHYITEHGVVPAECGVTDEAGEWKLKTRCALRSFCMWLHKGIDTMHYFCAWQDKSSGMGLLPPNLKELPADAKFDEVATPPMRVIRNLTRAFAGARPMRRTQPLQVDVVALGKPRKICDLGPKSPPLYCRDVFAFLPFQVHEGKFVIAVYVMTYDATVDMGPQRYRLKISAPLRAVKECSLYDPVTGRKTPVEAISGEAGTWEVEVPVVDYPRLLALGS
ncbi:MAG: hypothetical protein WBF17_25175 [Phycisphaerae bacterium]